jgi:hypothetical protein
MKNIIAVLALLAVLVSCNSNDSNIKYSYSINGDGEIKREMVAKNATTDIEIEMVGMAAFNAEGTIITGLTPGGYINYRNKNAQLNAVPSKNGVTVTIEESSRKISATSDTGKEILKEAIINIKKLQQKNK